MIRKSISSLVGAVCLLTVPLPAQAAVGLPPVASFTVSCEQLDCVFTDTSVDLDGTIASWYWVFGDGEVAVLQNPSHKFPSAGIYQVSLIVLDNTATPGQTSKMVSVTDIVINIDPVAKFGFECAGMTCTFDDRSEDPDGTIVERTWSFGDSSTGSGASPSHTYNSTGAFEVLLSVRDDYGARAEITKVINVTGKPLLHKRKVKLKKVDALVASGKVTSDFGPCVSGVKVTFEKRSGGKWKPARGKSVSSVTTDADGSFKLQLAGDHQALKGAKFRAKVGEVKPAGLDDHRCSAAHSASKKNR